jgi:hypothetical protein
MARTIKRVYARYSESFKAEAARIGRISVAQYAAQQPFQSS